jgi:PKD repeat protein
VVFSTAGSYTVSFTVTDADGDTVSGGTRTVTVESDYAVCPPSIQPIIQTTIIAGQCIDFSAIHSCGEAPIGNAPLTYTWNFGGGATNYSGLDPGCITYNTPGIYTVILTAADANGDTASGGTRTITVVPDLRPTASLNTPAANVSIVAGQSVSFSGTASGGNAPLTYQWNFGGGAGNSTVLNPGNVTFETAGTYTVTFTATDVDGDTVVGGTRTVTVAEDLIPTASVSAPAANDITIIAGQFVNFQGSASGGNAPLTDRKSTRLNSSHRLTSRMPSSA